MFQAFASFAIWNTWLKLLTIVAFSVSRRATRTIAEPPWSSIDWIASVIAWLFTLSKAVFKRRSSSGVMFGLTLLNSATS